jgi:hypothetical protein
MNIKIMQLRSITDNFENIINLNIKNFNSFIVEINNITECYLLYNKFNKTIPEKRFLFNDNFVLYKPTNINLESIEELYYNINSLSLYGEQKNLTYYNQLLEDLHYRLPVPESDILVKSSDNYNKLINSQQKKMMGILGMSYALTIININKISLNGISEKLIRKCKNKDIHLFF